ncbi:MAG: riboflavin synthase [Ferruginibacter sp.]
MFTGIIEQTGKIHIVEKTAGNLVFWVESLLSNELRIDQSVSHNGVCLTIEEIKGSMHRVTAIDETIKKTNLGNWQPGTVINLERCMPVNGRLDGHIVQGHVDSVGTCTSIIEKNGSREYTIKIDPSFAAFIIEKGSISLNGISLTIFNVSNDSFTVAIIPYTYMHTNMQAIKKADKLNIEFDIIGKYVYRISSLKEKNS